MSLHALLRLPLILTLTLGIPVVAQKAEAPAVALATLQEPPHVIWKEGRAQVLTVKNGQVQVGTLDAKGRLALPGLPPLSLKAQGIEAPEVRFPAPPKLAAVSDIHGNLAGLTGLLRAQGIMDARQRWTYGRGHLVIVGDVLDRGDGCTEILWLLRSLEAQARAQGGRVHMVMGNHESMVLKGDHRYVHPKYRALTQGLLPGLEVLYGPDSEQGRWLRQRPALLRIGRTLFVHGGISPVLLAQAPDLEAINRRLAAAWIPATPEAERKAILGTDGPLWYRGLIPGADSKRGDASPEHVAALLQAFDVDRVVVGHTTLERITAHFEGRVLGVDAGLKDGKPGELLLMEGTRLFRGLADGRREALVP